MSGFPVSLMNRLIRTESAGLWVRGISVSDSARFAAYGLQPLVTSAPLPPRLRFETKSLVRSGPSQVGPKSPRPHVHSHLRPALLFLYYSIILMKRKKETKTQRKKQRKKEKRTALLLHNLMICIYTLHQRKKERKKERKKKEGILNNTLDLHLLSN